MTLVYEGSAYPERGIWHLYADLRALPYESGHFDTVASISTLEHVGMDNTGYGSNLPRAADPASEGQLAVRELARVLRREGSSYCPSPTGEARITTRCGNSTAPSSRS